MRRRALWLALAFVSATSQLLVACPARRPARSLEGPLLGIYKGYFRDEMGHDRRFRLLLFARLPDRLHAEVLPPMGGPKLIVDGGGGKLSVALVDERVAYAGDSRADLLGKVIGVDLSLPALVHALLTGEMQATDVVLQREPALGLGLPRTFEVRAGERVLRIELRGEEPMAEGRSGIASGEPPAGFEVRPLAELEVGAGESLLGRETDGP